MKRVIPIIIEKDENGYFVIECPLFSGCYSQGKTLKEAKINFREVLDLVMEEPQNKHIWNNYYPRSVKLKTLTYA